MTTNTPVPADLVEAVAKAICDSLQADADAGDVGIIENFDLDPVYWQNTAQAAIAAYQAHMASDGVVQADRDRAQAYCDDPRHFRQTGLPGSGPSARQIMDEHFADHRRAAAVADRALSSKLIDDRKTAETIINATKQPDPRDAEIARLREALGAIEAMPRHSRLDEGETIHMMQERARAALRARHNIDAEGV